MNIIKINRVYKNPAEIATERYLKIHLRTFKGPSSERKRLNDLARARIDAVAWNAANFYSSKLDVIINEASSLLLKHEINTSSGRKAFHHTHFEFLKILKELSKSQPAGEVSFQHELTRIKEMHALQREQLDLKNKISSLGTEELDLEELGGDDSDSSQMNASYYRVFEEMSQLKSKLEYVSHQLAIVEGKRVDFRFPKLKPGGSLSMLLSNNHLRQLELFMGHFVVAGEVALRDAATVNRILKRWITTLEFDARPSDDELKNLVQEVKEAVGTFFRRKAEDNLWEHFDELANDNNLFPKEGVILKNHHDVPEDVHRELEASRQKYVHDINLLFERTLSDSKLEEERDSDYSDVEQSFEEPHDEGEEDGEEEKEFAAAKLVAKVLKYRRQVEASVENFSIYLDSDANTSEEQFEELKDIPDHRARTLLNEYHQQKLDKLNNLLDAELIHYAGRDDSDVECLGIVEPNYKNSSSTNM